MKIIAENKIEQLVYESLRGQMTLIDEDRIYEDAEYVFEDEGIELPSYKEFCNILEKIRELNAHLEE